MAARKRKVALTESWKENIRATQIMNRLNDCCMGEVDMTASQIKAAQIILAKILPDLSKQNITADVTNSHVISNLSPEQQRGIAEAILIGK